MIHKQVKLLDSSPCPVSGKHVGRPMGTVPAAYLDWLVGQEHLCRKYPEVVEYVAKNRKAIDQDLDKEEGNFRGQYPDDDFDESDLDLPF